MNTSQLKEKLIKKIQDTDNEFILSEISRVLEMEADDTEVYKLNAEQLLAVEEAREQIRNGQSVSHEEAKKKMEEWLNK